MNAGVEISPDRKARQLLTQFVVSSKPKSHVICVTQPGWHGDAFVLPDETIAPTGSGKKILLQNADPRMNKFSTRGSLEDWQDNVALYCRGNSRLTFVVNIAFAASLLSIARESTGGIHFYGPTSTGKTTTLQVGASVLGSPLGIETWRGTSNGIEASAALHNNSVLFLDEISQVNAHEVGQTIYLLANGCGKARMNKDTSARRLGTWLLLFVSSGEKTLEQVMAKAGDRLFGGQEVRFVNVHADAGSQMGVFEDLHGFTTASQLAKHLSSAGNQFYGTPNRGFLRSVCADIGRVRERIQLIQQHFRSNPRNANGEIGRVSSRFALIAAAGMLACDFGITKWDRDEVLSSVELMLDDWIENRGTVSSFDDSEGVKHVMSFIDQHGSSRFQPFSDPDFRISNRVGYKRENDDGKMEYCIFPEVFKKEVCGEFSATAVLRELERMGRLRRGTEKT
jgi:putative DNA primase/helicase